MAKGPLSGSSKRFTRLFSPGILTPGNLHGAADAAGPTEHPDMAPRSISHHIGVTFGRQILAALIQLVTVLIIARALGPQGNGQYTMSILIPSFLSTFLNLAFRRRMSSF